jgi:ribosomal protein L14E/L6E/L27E
MVFKRFVELGRVVYLAEGKDEGKLAAIVNIVDGNRVSDKRARARTHACTDARRRSTCHAPDCVRKANASNSSRH